MRRWILLATLAISVAALGACGSDNDDTSNSASEDAGVPDAANDAEDDEPRFSDFSISACNGWLDGEEVVKIYGDSDDPRGCAWIALTQGDDTSTDVDTPDGWRVETARIASDRCEIVVALGEGTEASEQSGSISLEEADGEPESVDVNVVLEFSDDAENPYEENRVELQASDINVDSSCPAMDGPAG